jgi:iron complex outermembrane receptor protein
VQDLSGARMPNAPLIKLNIGGQYDLRWKDNPLDGFITANYRYQSKVLTNLNQDPSLEVPAFGIFNLGFGVVDKQRKYKLSMFVNNVFDRHYALTGFNGLANWSVTPPVPSATATTATWTPARDAFRYFGIRLDAEF